MAALPSSHLSDLRSDKEESRRCLQLDDLGPGQAGRGGGGDCSLLGGRAGGAAPAGMEEQQQEHAAGLEYVAVLEHAAGQEHAAGLDGTDWLPVGR